MNKVDPKKQREFAVEVARSLQKAGHEALWAGGCVRDELLGLVPKDYDVATSARPDEVRELFGRRRTLAVGAAFGVIVVLGPRETGPIDVATFREDAAYSDGRRPDHVTYSTPQLDAQRRDFTINGLFFDPVSQRVLDYVDGQRDLERGVVRAIGDPRERLSEDKLRLLRAVRFAATFDFELDAATLSAVQAMAADVLSVSAERIGQEIRRMLTHRTRDAALRWLRRSKLLSVVLPEVAALDDGSHEGGPRWQTVLRVAAALHDPGLPLALAALLSPGGASDSVPSIRNRLRLSNKETTRLDWLLSHQEEMSHARSLPWPQLQRLLVSEGIEDLLALREAVASAGDLDLIYCREKLALPTEKLNPPPLISGDDLIAQGVPPGKHFQELLSRVRDAQLNEEIATKDEALALVERWRAGGT